MCEALIIAPNNGGDYHGIDLMDVVWKVSMVIIKRRLITTISFHKMLHRFRKGFNISTTSLEAKLLQQLTSMRGEVLYTIILDLHKVYDALDRDRHLEILKSYRVGPRAD